MLMNQKYNNYVHAHRDCLYMRMKIKVNSNEVFTPTSNSGMNTNFPREYPKISGILFYK